RKPQDRRSRHIEEANYLWDLFGGKIGTVAVTTIDEQQFFGTNSTSPTYTGADRAAAIKLRDRLIGMYPEVMNTQDLGQRHRKTNGSRTISMCCLRRKGLFSSSSSMSC
ncbi:MAG: hypothetical protein WAK69_11590, partial [Rhodoplanes sp.]